jgi:putative transcription factor
MMCEVCGREVPRTKTVTVEGTVLNVCSGCVRFGTEAGPAASPARKPGVPLAVAERLEARARRMKERDVFAQSGEEDLADDYAHRIRAARESRGWKQTELGARINERVTVIAKIESGTMVPNDDLIRRLERALEIKLKEKVLAPVVRKASAREGVTLGDLFDLKGEG